MDRETVEQIARRLEHEASLYVKENGEPGPLATAWGWREIARVLRRIKEEILKP